jgi:Uri superfamily endonuclease
MKPGIYVLLLYGEGAVKIGSLGTISFSSGFYSYVGSALGPGGLVRVSRHMMVALARDRKPRWHIDYLLLNPGFRLVQVFCAATPERLECPLAQAIDLPPIQGFGSSDCSCKGHLFFSPDNPEKGIIGAFDAIGLHPMIKQPGLSRHSPGGEFGNV